MFYIELDEAVVRIDSSQLYDAFHGKCYICECLTGNDYQTEHRIPWTADRTDKKLLEGWNLFLSCSRCNRIKSDNHFDILSDCDCGKGYQGIIDCTRCDPKKYIILKIDDEMPPKITVAKMNKMDDTPCISHTESLLTKIYCSEVMEDQKLYNLKSSIMACVAGFASILRQLMLAVLHNPLANDVRRLKNEIIKSLLPESPFSAFKRTCMEEMCDISSDAKIISVFEEILNDPRINPTSTLSCWKV